MRIYEPQMYPFAASDALMRDAVGAMRRRRLTVAWQGFLHRVGLRNEPPVRVLVELRDWSKVRGERIQRHVESVQKAASHEAIRAGAS